MTDEPKTVEKVEKERGIRMAIRIRLQPHLYDENTFEEFEKLCQMSDLDCGTYVRDVEIHHSAFDEIIGIIISRETLYTIAIGLATNVLYDSFKSCIVKLVKSTRSSKHFNSMKLESNGTKLIIESENVSEQFIKDGLDIFTKIALEKDLSQLSAQEKMLNSTIVFPNMETDEVEILGEMEYIKKHVMDKSPHKEKKDGQAENAHAE